MPAIQADIVATLGRDTEMVQQALDHLARLAGKPLADLDARQRDKVAQEFRATGGAPAATLVRVVLQCYYRDDRVLRSLGLELRAPFPQGYVLEEGDWALLDPVKARPVNLRRAVSRSRSGHGLRLTRPCRVFVSGDAQPRRGCAGTHPTGMTTLAFSG